MSSRLAPVALTCIAALAACGGGGPSPSPGGTPGSTAAESSSPVAFERFAFDGFRHDNGYAGRYYFPETFGSGVALFDLEGDGDLDLYAVQGGSVPGSDEDEARLAAGQQRPSNAFFLNDGSGAFVDASANGGDATVGEAGRRFGMGVSVGDLNGDGLEDLCLTNVGPDALLFATGDTAALFRDATPPALHSGPGGSAWTTASGMADFNRDGHLDLVVVGYTDWSAASDPDCRSESGLDYCDVNVYPGIEDRLFLGDGSGGFEEVSEAWGFGRVPGRGLGLCLADLDGDGLVDAYVANDTEANRTYLNQDGAAFLDRTAASGASSNMDGAYEAGMGVALGDVSDDGLADVVVTNFSSESNNLFVNLGRGRFRERSRPAGIAAASIPKLAFGVTLMDFDLDGREDLYTACGHVLRHIEAQVATWSWRQADQLLLATGPTRFREVELGALLGAERVGRGVAGGDLDGDGRPDLAVTHSGDELILARTRSTDPKEPARWLTLEARQAPREGRSNTTAVGARVELELKSGRRLVRWVRSGTSYLSQDDRRSHFGIPPGEDPVAAHITWPDGSISRHGLRDVALGRVHRIERP